ncbi:MAG: hypothetical protein ACR2MC_00155 [Actinomycetota bacterium]
MTVDATALSVTTTSQYGSVEPRAPYAHGSEPRDIDLPALRRVVRDCLLARLVLGEPTRAGDSLSELADAALLDHARLADEVRAPISEFWAAVHGS